MKILFFIDTMILIYQTMRKFMHWHFNQSYILVTFMQQFIEIFRIRFCYRQDASDDKKYFCLLISTTKNPIANALFQIIYK